MSEPKNGGLVGHAGRACVQAGKLAIQRHLMQRFFHGRVAQAKPLLHEVDAQHVKTAFGAHATFLTYFRPFANIAYNARAVLSSAAVTTLGAIHLLIQTEAERARALDLMI